jgi:hypothetical protein
MRLFSIFFTSIIFFIPVQALAEASVIKTYSMANGRSVRSGPEIIVRLDTPSALKTIQERWHPEAVEALSSKLYLLRFDPKSDIPSLCLQIAQLPGIGYAHPNGRVRRHVR